MRLLPSSALALGLATIARVAEAQPQFLVNELSFGHTGRINDRGQGTVPGFSISGTPNLPEVLSNRLILTPPAPGNTRGAVWADRPNEYAKWVADVDFRTNGPERGGGNLNIWLVKGGNQAIGQASIYTVGQFEGLALVVDQYGGSGGMIRGFLNDGATDFKTHHSVDSLAFGHCNYPYRNLGRPSQIKMRQTDTVFRIEVDGRLCFESDKISMPAGYHFGITAAAAENPDSFEVFKMVVMTENLNAKGDAPPQQQQQQQQQQGANADAVREAKMRHFGRGRGAPPPPPAEELKDEQVPDEAADAITNAAAQFADLHNRLQSVNHQLSTIFRTVASNNAQSASRHDDTMGALEELARSLQGLQGLAGLPDRVAALEGEVAKVQRELKDMRADLRARVKDTEHALKGFVGDKHGNMLEHVAVQASPRHGKLIFVIIGSQILLVIGYIYYERKKTLPKKYL
ncbi:hypothetical protein DL768_009697 [Monosporascus sp. mg162]|nr:hypothetical protein DL768_009697 [Monosporascus sp. mg162]